MTNWFKLSPDERESRAYLRLCAVYRCFKRYNASREWCKAKLVAGAFPSIPTKHREGMANRMLDIWGSCRL